MDISYLEKTIDRWRVRAGFIGAIIVILLSNPNTTFFIVGVIVCLIGLLIRTWATGHLRKEKELTVSGPYQYTRNPLYFSNLILGISIILGSCSLWVLIISAVYFFLFYPLVIKKEKGKMNRLFPSKYEEYKNKVPLFFPSLKPNRPSKITKFSWERYRKNKEYRALAGAVLFWVIMAGKIIFL